MSNNNDTNAGHNANDANDGNTNNKPTSANTGFLPNTPVDQDYLDDLAQSAVDEIGDLDLRSFMAHVMVEIEPWEVITRTVVLKDKAVGIRVQFLSSLALQVRDAYDLGEMEKDVIYTATLLHGIEYWLRDWVVGNTSVRDVMFTIVRSHLHELDADSPDYARMLRLCMDWGNEDEQSVFITWLQQRMHKAVQTLERMKL
jgi:hypothetical protein